MRHLGEVNEGTTATIVLSFVDENNAAVTPMSGTYRIDTGNGTPVRASTGFTPSGSTHSIALTATDNTIKDATLSAEPHIVTVGWTFGAGDKLGTEECKYDVKNLLYV